jgi:hypothetical protein
MSTASNDVLSWTNQDPRESVLFNSWGVLYRFQVRVIRQHCFFNSSIVFTDRSEPQRAERNNSMARHSAQQGRPSCKTRVGCQWRTRPHRHWKSKFSTRSDATNCIRHYIFRTLCQCRTSSGQIIKLTSASSISWPTPHLTSQSLGCSHFQRS